MELVPRYQSLYHISPFIGWVAGGWGYHVRKGGFLILYYAQEHSSSPVGTLLAEKPGLSAQLAFLHQRTGMTKDHIRKIDVFCCRQKSRIAEDISLYIALIRAVCY